jgi:hypothetical protein
MNTTSLYAITRDNNKDKDKLIGPHINFYKFIDH